MMTELSGSGEHVAETADRTAETADRTAESQKVTHGSIKELADEVRSCKCWERS
ncbi:MULTISPECIES: hypothetical protein [Cohnella]|uniref:hypothetical protein n=1 Tax=Cohnella TaxID=329857 RepID=UPI001594174F|nr:MULTISPECIES: hypothetical protein [Cohnella]MBN2980350.1 hypothetical protein [Cohnella algarum]